MKSWLAVSCAILVTGALAWPKASASPAQSRGQGQAGSAAVTLLPPGQRQAGNPGEKGATYYALEAQTTRLTTRFKDGHAAVTERGLAGDVTTTLRDQGGNERAKLRVTRIDAAHDTVTFDPITAPVFQAASDPAIVKPTLDWATRQAYSLTKDGVANLVWDHGVMRSRNAAPRDFESDVQEVETIWANGLTATMSRQDYSRRQIAPGHFVSGPALVSSLRQNGVVVGTAVWFERDRAFAYHLPQLMPAGMTVIFESDLKELYGGWPFTPDTTWINLQVIATHHFKTLVAKNGTIARNCSQPAPTRIAKLTEFFMPTLSANEAGCDYMHHLDGGVLRDCCDTHDRCFAKSGCTQSTFWVWWRSWSCDLCNLEVVWCFFVNGQVDPECLNAKACAG